MTVLPRRPSASFIGLALAGSIGLGAAFFDNSASAQTGGSSRASPDAAGAPSQDAASALAAGVACSTQSAPELLAAVQKASPPIPRVPILSHLQWLPLGEMAELWVPVPWKDNRKFRIVLAPPADEEEPLPVIIDADRIWAEPTAKPPPDKDFPQHQPTDRNTSIQFTPLWDGQPSRWRQPASVFLLICRHGGTPEYYGRFDTKLTKQRVCFALAIIFCAVFYSLAAYFTYCLHRDQRHIKGGHDDIHGNVGTNYAKLSSHFNPVILTADDNGLGSPSKLQILFFSLVIFGVVSYVWMSQHSLSDLSKSVLALMGISGAGAALSKATDVSRMRLDFDNWAWLVERKWLPEGGPAEINRARWKDVITEAGEFNVYRFQMLIFSALVGAALVFSATHLADFTIPDALLYLLGSSQAIYLGGKLAGSPSVGDLNQQIKTLQAKEDELLHALYERKPGKAPIDEIGLPLTHSELIERVGKCWAEYEDEWRKTQKMFESALVREVSVLAFRHRPPFDHTLGFTKALPLLIEKFEKAARINELLQDRLPDERKRNKYKKAFDKAWADYEKKKEIADKALAAFELEKSEFPSEEALLKMEKTAAMQKIEDEETQVENVRDALDSINYCIKRMNELNDEIEGILKSGYYMPT